MGERAVGAIVRELEGLAYLQIDPSWLAHHKDYPLHESFGDRLPFLFLDLEEGIEESAAVNYTEFEIVGRAESYKSYIGTDNREFPLVFKFRVQGVDLRTLEEALNLEVMQPALWLDSLKAPYTGRDGLAHAPPPCMLSLGQLFFGRVVATDVQISWQSPFDPDTLLPHGADVSCTFAVVREHIENYSFGASR
jgi:hypothetical protein